MKASNPDFYFVNLTLIGRYRPPLAVFRIFNRHGWFQVAPRFYHVKHVSPTTAHTLQMEIAKYLKPGEKVSVHGASVSEGSGGHLKPVPWESLYRREKEKRRAQRNIRQATTRRQRKRESMRQDAEVEILSDR